MVSLEKYLKNPCGTLSIPYWKAKKLLLPDGMIIVHERGFVPEKYASYYDQRYFRMHHDFAHIDCPELKGITLRTAEREDFETIVSVINRCYTAIQISGEQLLSYTTTPVYDRKLWVLALDEKNMCVGCAIADRDEEAGELALEWVQVLPDCRNRNVGKAMVSELLKRGKGTTRFATVSGRLDDPTNPVAFYRKCGFAGEDIWHILRK